jgi:hypothetical protein
MSYRCIALWICSKSAVTFGPQSLLKNPGVMRS